MTEAMLSDIKEAVAVLKRGGVIIYPTDTVWGLGCDATNAEAVEKIYRIKRRNHAKALITLVDGLPMLERTVEGIPDVAYELIDCSDKPISIIYDRGIGVAPNLTAEDGTLAVRVSKDEFSRELCRRFGRPVVSTSANESGAPTPRNFREISSDILASADYVCRTRRDDEVPHRSSTIIRLSKDGTFKIIRS